MSRPVLAIVGRPNVGKSTLFNRLVGHKKAVVHDRPGVTRDRLYEDVELLTRKVILVDTGGIEPAPDTEFLTNIRAQAMIAVEEADVIMFVVDARTGYTPADIEVADLLRRTRKPVVLAVNKVDGPSQDAAANDFWSVGLQEMHLISAEHGRGMYELLEAVENALPEVSDEEFFDDGQEIELDELRIAVVGRPNIGKSTLINRLIGEERHMVMDMPGTTMDPIDSRVTVGERNYLLVDTAGVRRRARIKDHLERFVSIRAIRSIERCHVTLLVIDGTEGITDQDAKLAQLIVDRGRALVILANKWDLAKNNEDMSARAFEDDLERRLPHARWAPHLFISAKTGKGVGRIFPMVEEIYKSFNHRVSTSKLNRFLEDALQAHSPPQRYHRPVRIYYMTQTRVRPPTFALFSNTPEGVGEGYKRYLKNRLRETYDLWGTPLRLHMKRRRKLGEEKQ